MSKIQTVAKEINRKSEALLEKLKAYQGELSGLNQSISAAEKTFDAKRAQEQAQKRLEEALAREKALEEAARRQEEEARARKEEEAAKTPPPAEPVEEVKPQPEQQKAAAAPAPEKKTEEKPFKRPEDNRGERPRAPRDGQRPFNRDGQAPRDGQRPFNRDGQAPRDGQRPFNRDGQAPRDGQRPFNRDGQRPFNRDGQAPRDGQRPFNRDGQRPAQPGQRPFNNQGPRKPAAPVMDLAPVVEKGKVSNYDPNKKSYRDSKPDDMRPQNRKNNKNGFVSVGYEDDRFRGPKKKQKQAAPRPEPIKIERAVITTEMISIKELAEKIGKPAAEIIKKLFLLGIMATINHEIDFDTASLVAADYDIELEQKLEKTFEEVLVEADEAADLEGNQIERPPVVTIMGHVDHGKTSLLDAIRYSNVTQGEAGGITQHIGAYMIEVNGKKITFIDTPGHEAFTAMRARGAQVTDVAIIVVAADDGIMPQTVEAINHVKAAKVPIIVAINKMDKPTANPDRIKQELTEYGLVAEDWGGDTVIVPVSAHTKEGIDNLLDMILLVAEVEQFKADPDRKAKGAIIEAKLDKGRGPVATVLVQNGTLKVGDTIIAGTAFGRVRAMTDDRGNKVTAAPPSMPVEVLGFNDVPDAGDTMYAVDDDKLSRQLADERKNKIKSMQQKAKAKASLDDLFSQIKEGQMKELNVIVKADVQGSVEAVKQALEKLSNDEVKVCTIHGGVGAISETDIMFASTSNAIVIGFNVRPDAAARALAEKEKVDVRLYRVIYQAIEDIEKAMKGLLAPVFEENILGHAEVRETFKISNVGTIAGSYVVDGKITRNAKVRLLRDNVVIFEGEIDSLKRMKDAAKEVASGYECGIAISGYNDIKQGDVIEAYVIEQVKQD